MNNKNKKQKKRIRVFPAVIVILVFAYIYFTFLYVYHGKVLDADTKQPIEGAVVVASWVERQPGGHSRLKDVKETLTDKNGEWKIWGARGCGYGEIIGNIIEITSMFTFTYYTVNPEFIVFKPGYCSWSKGFGIDACKEKMKGYNYNKSDNIGGVVELPKLTKREDRRRALPGTVGFSREFDKKQLKFLTLINEEHKNIFGEGDFEKYIKELKNEK